MTIAIVGSIVLAIVVFAFVLEPVLRARGDRVLIDEVLLSIPVPSPDDDPEVEDVPDDVVTPQERVSHQRRPVEHPLSGDAT